MKRGVLILIVVLVCCGFIPQHKALRSKTPQKSVSELYTEAIKAFSIHNDTLKAIATIEAILQQDSTYAPALNLLSRITQDPIKSLRYAERAYLSDTTNNHYLHNYAGALLGAEQLDRATPIFEKLVRTNIEPNNFRVLALLFGYANKNEKAVAVLDSARILLGRTPELERLRLHLLMSLGRTLEAEVDAKRAVESEPYVAENHLALAQLYMQTHRDSLALVSIQNAIAIDSLATEPWLELCSYYHKKEDYASYLSALTHLFANESLPLNRKLEEWNDIISNKELYAKYLSLYDAIIKQLCILHPDNRDVTFAYIRHLFSIGQYEESMRVYKRLLDVPSPRFEDFDGIIALESYLSREDSVKLYLDRGLNHFPNNVRFLSIQGSMAMSNKEYDKAYDSFNKALLHAENDDARGEIYCSVGLLEYERRDMKACYKAYNEAIKCFKGDRTKQSFVLATIGDIEHSLNNPKASYKAYDKALKYNPDNEMVLNNYAYFLSLEERDLERALEMAERALAQSENNPTYLDTKAWVLYKLGRFAEAKKVMQQAISLDESRSPEYPLHYGDILHALGEEFMAKVYWRKALERGADKAEIEKRFLPEKK